MKTTIQDLKKIQESEVSAAIKKHRVFFAFSNEQFAEGKTPLKEGEKYVRCLSGGFIPNSEVKEFFDTLDSIVKNYNTQAKKLKKDHILYELFNHECFYTGDISDACRVLPYTKKAVLKVYQDYRQSPEYKENW